MVAVAKRGSPPWAQAFVCGIPELRNSLLCEWFNLFGVNAILYERIMDEHSVDPVVGDVLAAWLPIPIKVIYQNVNTQWEPGEGGVLEERPPSEAVYALRDGILKHPKSRGPSPGDVLSVYPGTAQELFYDILNVNTGAMNAQIPIEMTYQFEINSRSDFYPSRLLLDSPEPPIAPVLP